MATQATSVSLNIFARPDPRAKEKLHSSIESSADTSGRVV
jgi:hypothetical protein